MKTLRSKLCLVAALAWAAALPVSAEDIDLYAGVDGGTSAPNVLFYLDNTSNWSANSQAWKKTDVLAKCNALADATKRTTCAGYVEQVFGANASLVQGAVEARALKLVLNELVCGAGAKLAVNAGIMMFAPSNLGSADGASVTSTYVRHRVAPMDSARCATILADLEWIASNPTDSSLKTSSSAGYGAGLYEAFKYFGGWTSPAGYAAGSAGSPVGRTGYGPERYGDPTPADDPDAFTDGARMTYRSPLSTGATCGNNYLVLVGNTWPNADYGTNANASPHPTNTLMSRLGYDPGAQIYPKPLLNKDKADVRFGDEWAKFLYTTDISDQPAAQNIRMFTVDVYNSAPSAKQSSLLKSMADQSGVGGYFTVGGDLYALISAFTDILTQIASVNSVFASASLPVSVNAQGTFLNQVFMGVFRPDAEAQQRWMGNLKQYRFGLDGSSMYLADAAGAAAVDAVNTGFIQNCAVSYWTSDSANFWETITGLNRPNGCLTTALSPWSDRPDGPIVERGGAAQRLRGVGHAARNIRTCSSATCASVVDFASGSAATFGLTEDMAKWARGENRGDGYHNSATLQNYGLATSATRPTVHGEVVHSRPLAVNYGVDGADDVVVFYGAGDAMLRAINGNQGQTDGNELWAFVAPEHWSKLERLRANSPLVSFPNVSPTSTPTPQPKTYFFDGSIGGYQERTASAIDKVWIYPTMRRGGRAVYAFDVTKKPGTGLNQPSLMWRYGDAEDSRMGQTWSTPVAFRVKGIASPLVAFGAGYDDCEDNEDAATACAAVTRGRGVVVRDAGASSPSHLRFFDPGADGGRFVADVAAVDVNGDGFADALYAADTRGNVWRINTSNPADGYNGYAGGVADWPMVRVAAVAEWGGAVSERRKLLYAPSTVVLGSQVTVMIGSGDREKPSSTSNAAKVLNRFYGIRDDVSKTTGVVAVVGYGSSSGGADLPALKNVTDADPIDPTTVLGYRGWFRDLSTTSEPYEQVVTTPLTLAGVTYFSTFQAKSSASSCLNLGTGRAYQIDFQTGTRLADKPLVTTFVSQGIPPSPVGGVVLIDGKRVPFVIGGPGPTPLSPSKVVPKVRPDRKPVFRFQRIDKS